VLQVLDVALPKADANAHGAAAPRKTECVEADDVEAGRGGGSVVCRRMTIGHDDEMASIIREVSSLKTIIRGI
jgi:hypothetical protein